jgi:hypothetical protein
MDDNHKLRLSFQYSADDMVPLILGARCFLKNQGFNVGPARILQDKKSAILLEENGMASTC